MGFIGLNHYQIIALSRTVNINFPSMVSTTWDGLVFLNDLSVLFKPACSGYASFKKALIIKSLSPLIFAAMFVMSFCASRAFWTVRPAMVMERDRTLNCFFSLIFTFFAAIASMAFSIFKCAGNPNGKDTLIVDRS